MTVHKGDVGSNANMEYADASGQQSAMTIDQDYGMYYGDPPLPTALVPVCEPHPPTPTVQTTPRVIKDPNYYGVSGHYPCMTRAVRAAIPQRRPRHSTTLAITGERPSVPAVTGCLGDPAMRGRSSQRCRVSTRSWRRRIREVYLLQALVSTRQRSQGREITSAPATSACSCRAPTISGRAWTSAASMSAATRQSQPGVALMFDECCNLGQCIFTATTADHRPQRWDQVPAGKRWDGGARPRRTGREPARHRDRPRRRRRCRSRCW